MSAKFPRGGGGSRTFFSSKSKCKFFCFHFFFFFFFFFFLLLFAVVVFQKWFRYGHFLQKGSMHKILLQTDVNLYLHRLIHLEIDTLIILHAKSRSDVMSC